MDQTSAHAVPESFAQVAYVAIRNRLVMLEIPPGAPIDDDSLAQELGMGRTPVREALKRLQVERLVQTFPRRGTFATDVNITDLGHISEVRKSLESTAAALASARASAQERARLRELVGQLQRRAASAQDPAALMRLDLEMHQAVYAATDNPYLEDLLLQYHHLATRIWMLFADRLPDLVPHVAGHAELISAIEGGQAAQAGALAAEHVACFEQAVRLVI
jgi:DNA-binding GntR family transcriptional regulator